MPMTIDQAIANLQQCREMSPLGGETLVIVSSDGGDYSDIFLEPGDINLVEDGRATKPLVEIFIDLTDQIERQQANKDLAEGRAEEDRRSLDFDQSMNY